MAQELQTLTAQVKASTDVEASAVILIAGLAAQILALVNQPTQLTQLANNLRASSDALAAAVAANTVAAPAV